MNQTVHNQSQKPSDDNYIQVLLNQISFLNRDSFDNYIENINFLQMS